MKENVRKVHYQAQYDDVMMWWDRRGSNRSGREVSYKEAESEEEEDEDEDMIEVDWSQQQQQQAAEDENAQIIEKILDHRIGKKGGKFSILRDRN